MFPFEEDTFCCSSDMVNPYLALVIQCCSNLFLSFFHWKNYEPDEEHAQTNAGIWSAEVKLKKPAHVWKFFTFAELLQEVLATGHHNVWFMHDNATANFSIAMRNHFYATYLWSGYGGPVAFSPHSSDLNTLDFFF
ncbi:hypothetical protein TNCV_3103361 [Trichonephila clavipes]|nr:hypothetical protein TNCV_3103361 [Trichonephila clavipes]